MYKRVLLKFSGEALANDSAHIFDYETIDQLANIIKALHDEGVEIGIVIGAGNICRGSLQEKVGFDRINGDYMGMLGTVINALAVSSILTKKDVPTKVFSAVGNVADHVELYHPEKAKEALGKGQVVFFAGGTGKPYFTTDTGAAMRAKETECEAIFMGKHGVEGVYDKDPNVYADARFIKEITYEEMLKFGIMVMDATAVELLKDSDIQIRVFSAKDAHNFLRVAHGEDLGTTCKRSK